MRKDVSSGHMSAVVISTELTLGRRENRQIKMTVWLWLDGYGTASVCKDKIYIYIYIGREPVWPSGKALVW